MASNMLSTSVEKIPAWIVQTVLGLLLSSGIAWATWTTATASKHEARITKVETQVEDVKDDIREIKDGQKDISKKLDRVLEGRHR